MSNTVRGAVLSAPRRLELEDFDRPRPGPGEALMRVEANGICGTDVEIFDGHVTGTQFPLILGHEPVGVIEEIDETASTRWKVGVGDRIGLDVVVPCRWCASCTRGQFQACSDIDILYGITGIDTAPGLWGGFAEYMVLRANSVVHPISRSVPLDQAAMYNMLGAGVRWVTQLGQVRIGDTVLVLGTGQRGLACVIAAKAAGAGRIIVTGLDRDRDRLAVAQALGADDTICVEAEEVIRAVAELTAGRLADLAIEVTPMAHRPVLDAINSVRHGGRVVLAGLKGREALVGVPIDSVALRAITLVGADGVDSASFDRAISIIESGRFPLDRLRTRSVGLDGVGRVLSRLADPTGIDKPLHVTVRPNG